jgi:hypothetical protein
MAMMTELISSIRMQAHRANIERYRKLMAGRLTRVEREICHAAHCGREDRVEEVRTLRMT